MKRSDRGRVLGANQLYENFMVGPNYCAMRRYIRRALVQIFGGDEENTVLEEKAVLVQISEFKISQGLLYEVTKPRTLLRKYSIQLPRL